ncbi:MAG: hypothetical protein R6U27_14185 [Desulfobacterales bacterium]
MEIISLLPFLLFLVFVLIAIIRTKKKVKDYAESKKQSVKTKTGLFKSEKNEKKKQTGWKNILIDTLAEIQREIKAAQEKKQAKDSKSWETPGKPLSSKLVWSKDSPVFQPPPIPSERTKKKIAPSSGRRPESAPKAEEIKAPQTKSDARSFKKPTIKQLQNAVLWSEILAPPVALRKDQDYFNV